MDSSSELIRIYILHRSRGSLRLYSINRDFFRSRAEPKANRIAQNCCQPGNSRNTAAAVPAAVTGRG
jgi:hypothetical protein